MRTPKSRRHVSRENTRRLRIEPLEDRRLLAVISFEEAIVAPGNVRSQYSTAGEFCMGVEFLGGRQLIYEPAMSTSSGTHALTNLYGEFNTDRTLDIRFTVPQSSVSVQVGLEGRSYEQDVTAWLYAYSGDTPGTGYLRSSSVPLGRGPRPIDTPLSVTSSGDLREIRSVRIIFTGGSVRGAYESIDDLTFSHIGVCTVDTSSPTVQITLPTTDGTVINTPNALLGFRAADYGTGVAMVEVEFLDTTNNILSSFYVGGGPTGRELSYDVDPNLASLVDSLFHTQYPDGTRTIRVRATDFAGNVGEAVRLVTVELPGPDMNLYTTGMEITQGIQRWVARNTETTKPRIQQYPNGHEEAVFDAWYPELNFGGLPLVKGRTTVVRVFAGVEGSTVPIVGAKATLMAMVSGWPATTLLVPAPGPFAIYPVEREITVFPGDTLEDQRQTLALSWNFILPEEWTQLDYVQLVARIEAPSGISEKPDLRDGANRLAMGGVRFRDVPRFDELVHLDRAIRFVSGVQQTPATQAQIDADLDFLAKIYPIDETTIHTQPDEDWSFQDDPSSANATLRAWQVYRQSHGVPGGVGVASHAIIDNMISGAGWGGSGASVNRVGANLNATFSHEIGHSAGSLSHAGGSGTESSTHSTECDSSNGGCDSNYPWPHGTIGLTTYGFDVLDFAAGVNLANVVKVPGTTESDPHDIMSYGRPRWISSRNWIRMFNAFTDSDVPYPSSKGTAVGDFLLVSGGLDNNNDWVLGPAYEMELSENSASGSSEGRSSEGPYRIELLDGGGRLLSQQQFDISVPQPDSPVEPPADPPLAFVQLMPLPEGASQIAVYRNDELLVTTSRSPNSPVIEITSPTTGGFSNPKLPVIRWNGQDLDGDPLHYMVEYSARVDDAGDRIWQTLTSDWTSEELAINLEGLAGSDDALVRVLATDGFNTSVAVSPSFVVANNAPRVRILGSHELITIERGNRLMLRATASDLEDGPLDDASLIWLSNRDGNLGSGNRLDVDTLSVGVHQITLAGLDSEDLGGFDTVEVEVQPGVNYQPVADAGPDVPFGSRNTNIRLDGNGSSDPNGDPIQFYWTIIASPYHSNPSLSSQTAAQPDFRTGVAGDYVLQLTVHDGQTASFADTVTIHVTPLPADVFEPNDSRAEAFDLVTGDFVRGGLSIHDTNNGDWYRWTPLAGVPGNLGVDIRFSHWQGNLDMELWDDSGLLLARSETSTDNEFIYWSVPLETTSYYIHVYGNSGATNPSYKLEIDGPGWFPRDAFEPNETLSEATVLPSGDQEHTGLTVHPAGEFASSDDWYQWTASADGLLAVDASFANALGNLDLQLYDANGTLLTRSENSTDIEYAQHMVLANETIYIRVFGRQGWSNPDYTLRIDGPEPTRTMVTGRHIFYNNSAFDENDPAADARDDRAIATDKRALLPGEMATADNYTSYSQGINGIMVDIAGLPRIPTADDFLFKIGNDGNPDTWATAPQPTEVTTRLAPDGSRRVTVTWPDRAIEKQWLQVTVKATDNTGLPEDDIFYFGNAIGEAGDQPINTVVNATDEIAARNFQHSAVDRASIDDPYDYNRDGLVNATDQIIARNNQTNPLTMLRLIAVPDIALKQAAEPTMLQSDLDWFYEFEQMSTKKSQQKRTSVEEAVDRLLAAEAI